MKGFSDCNFKEDDGIISKNEMLDRRTSSGNGDALKWRCLYQVGETFYT